MNQTEKTDAAASEAENAANIIEQKKACRARVKAHIKQFLSTETAQNCGEKAFNIFSATELYKNCRTILLFVSKNPEISTFHFIEAALKDGKKVAVPKCRGEKMDFFFLRAETPLTEQLVLGAFDILEPRNDLQKCGFADFGQNCIFIVPGLAFDPNGRRLGKGKGFYDRFIDELFAFQAENGLLQMPLVGLCYSIQIEKNVPCQSFDAKMNYILCENKFFAC